MSIEIKTPVEAVALSNYLSITRKSGLPDSLAEETYAKNKESADALAAFTLKHDIERGDRAKAVLGIVHNSGDKVGDKVEEATQDVGGVSGQRLRQFIERVERLEEEKSALMEDIKEVYAELKGVGFEAKIVRKLVSIRKMDTEKRREEEELLELYKAAVGLV